jgi:hypothetical protein
MIKVSLIHGRAHTQIESEHKKLIHIKDFSKNSFSFFPVAVFKPRAAKRFGLRINVAGGERWELSLATFQENRQPAVELRS